MKSLLDPESVELVWTQAERRLEAQLRQADALDTKAGIVLGVQAIAVPVLGSIAARLTPAGQWVAAGVVAGLLIAGGFSFAAFRTQRYDRSPRPEELWRFARGPSDELKVRFLSTRFRAIQRNSRKLERKARNLAISLTTTAVVAFVVGMATIMELIG